MAERNETRKARVPRWKWVLFRLFAIGIGLLPILCFELIARGAGWGIATEANDPYIGFESVPSLFVADQKTGQMEVDSKRAPYFRPQSFPIQKPANEFRIFCLGGSTVQGRPYAIETSFTTWLEISLNHADPSKTWRVVNCGGVSYASYRLAPILEEVLKYEPDLIILYTGHNEFLEDRTYDKIKRTPEWQKGLHRKLASLRTYNLLRGLFHSNGTKTENPKSVLPSEVDALLDYENGLADYQRDETWKQNVIDHFDHNLDRMIQMTRKAGVKTILVNPVVNLVDQPPFKSEHRKGLSGDEKARFAELYEQGRKSNDAKTCLELLTKAKEIDDEYAAVHYAMGQAYLALGKTNLAKTSLVLSKETDICPLRIVEPMRESIFRIGKANNIPIVDLQKHFDLSSPNRISGRESLVDHVHPSIAAHQKIASILLEEIAKQQLASIDQSMKASWKRKRDSAYRKHLGLLDALYFETGQLRLEGLIRWTQGKSKKPRGEKDQSAKVPQP